MSSGTGVPRISVIIPCRNEARYIEGCLRAVLAFEAPEGGYEVIVADGMSDDGTRDLIYTMAKSEPRLRMIDNPARTTPCALNAAIRAARGSVIVRIDAHSEYASDYLARCVETLDSTGADNVGGPWVARGNGYLQRAIAAAFGSPFAVGGARGHMADYEGPVDTVYLGCWPRQTLERAGLFDEELVRNQDDELNLRITRAGGVVWQSPYIKSYYFPRASLRALYRQYYQYGYWKVRVMQKHGTPASLRHLVPGAFVATLALLALAAPFTFYARAAFGALAGLYALFGVFAALRCAAGTEWGLAPVLPVVFACYHMGYGTGFLLGIWDFAVRRRSTGRCVALTRH